jgi:hypothetical protein
MLRLHVASLNHLWVSVSLIRDYAPGLNIMGLIIAGFFLDFIHNPVFWKLENTTFRKLDCFHPQVRGKTPTVLCPLERANLND